MIPLLAAVAFQASGLPVGGVGAIGFDTRRQDMQVPPGDEIYRLFYGLARDGLIRRYPHFHFNGGRTFTRRELAEVVADIIHELNRRPSLATPERLAQVRRLIEEFGPELRRLGADLSLPPEIRPAAPPPEGVAPEPTEAERFPLRLFGSDITTWSLTEGKGNDSLSSLLDFNVEMVAPVHLFRAEMVGTLGDRGFGDRRRHTGDIAFSDRYVFDLSERYVEFFLPREVADDVFAESKIGDLRNTTYARGLMLGAVDPDGYQLKAGIPGTLRTQSLWGKTDDNTAVFGSRAEAQLIDTGGAVDDTQLSVGLSAADVDAREKARRGFAYGTDVSLRSNFVDLEAEAVDVEESGRGLFAGATVFYSPDLNFFAKYRNYRRLLLRVNNAPIYEGLSGGDDEDDESLQVGSVAVPWRDEETRRFLQFTARVEQSRDHDASGDLRDGFVEARVGAWEGGELAAGLELERDRGGDAYNRLAIVDFSQQLPWKASVRANYARDDRDGDVIHTARPTFRIPVWTDDLVFEYNHTYRVDRGDAENTFQPRLLWTITDTFFFSARFSHSDDEDTGDMIDFTLVMRW